MKQSAFCKGMWPLQTVEGNFKKKKFIYKKIYVYLGKMIVIFNFFFEIFLKIKYKQIANFPSRLY